MKYVLVILSFIFPILINAQTKEIEISVDNFYRIYFNTYQIIPTSDSEVSIDYWGKAFTNKTFFDDFIVCLDIYYCTFEIEQNPKIVEERSNYILSRFENDYQINRKNFIISFFLEEFCDEKKTPVSTDVVLLKK